MGREVKRVALDFDAPLEAWAGYHRIVEGVHKCPACDGRDMSPDHIRINDYWYGQKQPYGAIGDARGAHRWSPDDPEIRPDIIRKMEQSPEFYGTGEAAYRREAARMCAYYNEARYARVTDEEAQAIADAGELPLEWTHVWQETANVERPWRWVPAPREDWPEVTGRSISAFNIKRVGGSVGWGVLTRRDLDAIGARADCGAPGCVEGLIFDSPAAQAAYEGWERTEPPEGEGWQMWQTVSDGPISPVFTSPEGLAKFMAGSLKYADGLTSSQWLKFIKGPGWAPSAMGPAGGRIRPNAAGVLAAQDIFSGDDLPDAPPSAPYDEAAHDAFFAAEEAGTEVENTATNLRFLLLGLYTSGCAGAVDLNTARGQALLDTLLDAAEGRAFKPFDFRQP